LSVGFGLVTASVLALAGVGLSLQFGVTNFVNFAYGDYMTLGAYIALVFVDLHANLYLAMLLAGIGVGIYAVLVNRLLFKRFIDRRVKLLTLLIVTIGVSLTMQNVIQAIFGAQFQTYPVTTTTSLNVGPFLLTPQQLLIMGIAAVCLLGVHLVLSYTRMGKAMRAMSDNLDLAEASGIDTVRVTDVTWGLTGFLAGVAGVVLVLNTSTFTPIVGASFLFLVFAVVILGGIGKPYGAMLGALVIGIVTEVAGAYMDAAYADAMAFLVMIVLLFLRPQGLFSSRGRA
jgi:branched-chain amino acid transport system permease protein/neutral amino acid transport system permease protein